MEANREIKSMMAMMALVAAIALTANGTMTLNMTSAASGPRSLAQLRLSLYRLSAVPSCPMPI